MTSQLLQEQIAYYQARADEYDEWFYRTGRYDRGETLNQLWFEEVDIVKQELLSIKSVEHILELACGTGIWTQELVKIADTITAIDASREMIAINQAKVQSEKVNYEQADLFTWQPSQQYDMVYFSFWLSHVPPEKLATFLQTVNQATKTGGTVFILDSRKVNSSTADNHMIPDEGTTLTRKLNDGRSFQIVKIFYTVEGLREALEQAGFEAEVMVTPNYFITAKAIKQ